MPRHTLGKTGRPPPEWRNGAALPREIIRENGESFVAPVPQSAGFSPERIERLNAMLQASVGRSEVAGVNALIVRHGAIAYAASIGMSDRASGAPMRADTIFRIYSMSKPVTSVAAMILLEEGRFLLSDPVRMYLPELGTMKVYGGETTSAVGGPAVEMTIADLMTHTAGFTYGGDESHPVDAVWNAAKLFRQDGTIEDVVARLSALPLKYQPGTQFEYSISHDVLGALIARVSGMRFGAFLAERIFEPLGMRDTGFAVPHDKLSRLATLYEPEGSGLKAIDLATPESRWAAPVTFEGGGQGLVSTIGDYARFCAMLLGNGDLNGTRIISRKSVELMTANRLNETQRAGFWMKGYGYGLGVGVLLDPAANANLGTAGEYTWAGSASTYFWIDPVEDLFALLFAQLEPSSASTIPRRFKAMMYQALL